MCLRSWQLHQLPTSYPAHTLTSGAHGVCLSAGPADEAVESLRNLCSAKRNGGTGPLASEALCSGRALFMSWLAAQASDPRGGGLQWGICWESGGRPVHCHLRLSPPPPPPQRTRILSLQNEKVDVFCNKVKVYVLPGRWVEPPCA